MSTGAKQPRPVSAERKRDILSRHSRNEPRALADPAAFLSVRGLPVPATLAEQRAAVRALFAQARKDLGVE